MKLPAGLRLRNARESDHPAILEAIPRWWDTPNRDTIGLLLPRLFLQHFAGTSWVIEEESGELAAFLVGFQGQDDPSIAYIHFVGVDPEHRQAGMGRDLYEHFFARMRERGCTTVKAITGPANRRSQDFHAAMGFTLGGDREIEGVMAYPDYDGPGQARVTFTRSI